MHGWLKPKAAANYCNVGERTLRTWLKDEGLRSSRVRGSILIKISWIDDFIEKHEVGNGDEVDRIVSDVCKELV
jgi:excisionase family DNA binding protein